MKINARKHKYMYPQGISIYVQSTYSDIIKLSRIKGHFTGFKKLNILLRIFKLKI